jgi:hypothetical protein
MPRNRSLRCLNWVPKQAGIWELRWGYDTVSMSAVTASAIHSMFPYRTLDGTKYVLFMQGTSFQVLNAGTGDVTSPTIRGDAVASSAKGMGFFAANRFHYGNGTDQKWFDGTNWRTSGLPELTASDVQYVTITEGVREFTAAEASTVTLTSPAGGSFPVDTLTGHLIYVAIFDTSLNEIGPATINVGSGRVVVAASDKITVANLPNLSSVNANWVKLIGGTADGSNLAYFFTNTSTNIVSGTPPTTVNILGIVLSTFSGGSPPTIQTRVTVETSSAHGLSIGQAVLITGVNPSIYNGSRTVATVPDATHFSFVIPGTDHPAYVSGGTSTIGTGYR